MTRSCNVPSCALRARRTSPGVCIADARRIEPSAGEGPVIECSRSSGAFQSGLASLQPSVHGRQALRKSIVFLCSVNQNLRTYSLGSDPL